jgi:hypothetical protein
LLQVLIGCSTNELLLILPEFLPEALQSVTVTVSTASSHPFRGAVDASLEVLSRTVSLTDAHAEALVMQAARECFDSATSTKDPLFETAKGFLGMLSAELPSVVAETNLLQAFAILAKNRIDVLPVQLRLSLGKFDIVARLVRQSKDIYKHPNQVLAFAELVGIDNNTQRERVPQSCASEAVKRRDFSIAFELWKALSRQHTESASSVRNNYSWLIAISWIFHEHMMLLRLTLESFS